MLPIRDTSTSRAFRLKDNPSKWKQKKSGGNCTFISGKIDCKSTAVTGDKEGDYLMINVSIHQEDITIANIYAPNIGEVKY